MSKINIDDNLYKSEWVNEIDDRVKKLRKNNFHLEAFYLFIQIVETKLRESIVTQEEWVRIILEKYHLIFDTKSFKNLDKKMLGDLIQIFDTYCSDKTLVLELKNLASFRNKIVHHLNKNSVDRVNVEAESFYKKFWQTVIKLFEYEGDIWRKREKKAKNEIRNYRRKNKKKV